MANFVIIGVSTFGDVLARKLYSMGEEVLVIDRDKDKIQEIKNNVTQAIVADATDRKILEKLIGGEAATAIICLGDNVEESVMVTYHLRELGVKKIVAKANSVDHGKVLQLLGAAQIIHPERDMALRVAENLLMPHLLESLPLTKDYSIVEFAIPEKFIGKTLSELRLRNEYNVNVLAVKWTNGEEILVTPSADYLFKEEDTIVVLGHSKDIEKIRSK